MDMARYPEFRFLVTSAYDYVLKTERICSFGVAKAIEPIYELFFALEGQYLAQSFVLFNPNECII